jgi:uncharacterized coiled-coil protein SlyX
MSDQTVSDTAALSSVPAYAWIRGIISRFERELDDLAYTGEEALFIRGFVNSLKGGVEGQLAGDVQKPESAAPDVLIAESPLAPVKSAPEPRSVEGRQAFDISKELEKLAASQTWLTTSLAKLTTSLAMFKWAAGIVASIIATFLVAGFLSLTHDMDETSGRISKLETTMETRFAGVDTRFAGVDTRFAKLETTMETRFAKLETTMETRFAGVEARFAGMETRFANQDAKLEALVAAVSDLRVAVGKLQVSIEGPFVSTTDRRRPLPPEDPAEGERPGRGSQGDGGRAESRPE